MELSSRPISIFCSLVYDLVESWENVVSELNLSDGGVPCYCQSDGESDNTLFCQRGIEDSIDTIPFTETGSTTEDSSKFHILTEHFGSECNKWYVGSV